MADLKDLRQHEPGKQDGVRPLRFPWERNTRQVVEDEAGEAGGPPAV